jgi:hypothetical protein
MLIILVQTWKGWSSSDLNPRYSTLGGFKTLIGAMFLVLGAFLILLCLIPLVLQSFRTFMNNNIEERQLFI